MSGSLVVLERGARDSIGYRWMELQSRLHFLHFYYSSYNLICHMIVNRTNLLHARHWSEPELHWALLLQFCNPSWVDDAQWAK